MLRRHFNSSLAAAIGVAGIACVSRQGSAAISSDLPPIRAITRGPKFHWRGYYDKNLFDASDRYVLANEVDFEGRTPEASDKLTVGMVDLQKNDEWIELGNTTAWNWQQGCMLQWIPGEEYLENQHILWNDREDGQFVCRILELASRRVVRTLPMPIYCVEPNGQWGLSVDFRRLNECRPGYGYAGIPDPYASNPAPEKTGIWRVDLKTGESQLLLSYAQIAAMEYASDIELKYDPSKSKHWFNHLLVAPGGKRFLFLHRWRELPPNASRETLSKTGFSTRMWTVNADGTSPYVVDPYGKTSHFVWRDENSICAWAWHPSHRERFYLYEDQSDKVTGVGVDLMLQNGHNTYLPNTNNDWILNDTYPDKGRIQHPYLYQVSTNRRVPLAGLLSPDRYQGEFRCDNHPSASRSGRQVIVDSTHDGKGRQVYLIDVSSIVGDH
jgi:hypothetical protein